MPAELLPQRQGLLVPPSEGPAPTDMIAVAATPEDLDLPTPTLDDVFDLVSELPFEHSMLIVSITAAEVYHHARDQKRQLRLAADLFAPDTLQRIERFVGGGPARFVFDLRFLLALQRVLIVHAAWDSDPARDLTSDEVRRLADALLGLAGALPRVELPQLEEGEEPDWYHWTSFFAQSGAWYADPYILEAVARTFAAFGDIASSSELAHHHARTEVDERLTAVYGLNLSEQLGVGLACAAISKAVDFDAEPQARTVHLAPGFLAKGTLASREGEAIELVSATREQLREALVASGERPDQIAWDHSLLERYPLVRLSQNRMRLTSPRALVAWMTRGLHYRLLDAAGEGLTGCEAHQARGLFLTFTGALGEDYVRRVVAASLRQAEAARAVRIYGEVAYHIGRDRHDSPDLALDAGPDLVLVEVYSGRMSLQARTDAGSEALAEFVQRAVADKLGELADRTRDLLAGRLRYDDEANLSAVRVWPVLVLAGDAIAPTPLLWGYLRATCEAGFVDDARVQRPVICDLDDLEVLLALAEEGHHLPDLLAAFLSSGVEEFPPRNWVAQTYGLERRPRFVENQFNGANEQVRQALFGSANS